MAMMLLYDRYRRLFGVRRISELENPKVRPIARFALPRGTVYHYMPTSETELGPDKDGEVIRAAQRLVYIDHVPDLLAKEGKPRPTYQLLAPMMQKYRRENMAIRPMRDYEMVTKELMNMVVCNYAMIPPQYRYMRSTLMAWWNWKNLRTTIWMHINSLNTPYERHHIVPMELPSSIPALSDLRKAERGMTPNVMKVFNSRERLDLLDVFIWLGEHRERSPMGKLDPAKYDQVDLLIRRNNGFMTINVGLLDSWRKTKKDKVSTESFVEPVEKEEMTFFNTFEHVFNALYAEQSHKDDGVELSEEDKRILAEIDSEMDVSMESSAGYEPKTMQLRFLKMIVKIMAKTSVVISDVDDAEEDGVVATQTQSDSPDSEEGPDLDGLDEEDIDRDDDEEEDIDEFGTMTADTEGAEMMDIEDEEKELEAELDEPASEVADDEVELTDEDGNVIVESATKEPETIQAIVSSDVEHTLTSSIQSRIDDLADKGMMTAAQYRRMQRLAESYKTMPDPYNPNKTVEESLDIPEESLVMPEGDTYPESDAVMDPSMLQSTVEKMDSQYIEKVMKSDILNVVMSVQKAGVAVTSYKVENYKDTVSDYQIHKVQLTPVAGQPSTITFRVPNVDKRGVYMSNGQRYRLRTQKTDK